MIRSLVALFVGFALALLLSTIGLGLLWGGRDVGRGQAGISLIIALLVVFLAGMTTGVVAERKTVVHGAVLGVLVAGFTGIWRGSFPMKLVFFAVPLWRTAMAPLMLGTGALGGWVAGRLIAPGGPLAADTTADRRPPTADDTQHRKVDDA
jgi:ascorbate-specific PTS system EIIC-type component UlaA